MSTIEYQPDFRHKDWLDNVSRVKAGGEDGFNRRFHDLEDEFQQIADVVTAIKTELDTLAKKPTPKEVKTTLAPVLVATAGEAWAHRAGLAERPGTQTGAHGMMSVDLPHGSRILSLTAAGRNGAAAGGPGAGNLRIALQRQGVAADAGAAERIARVVGTGDPFQLTEPADSQFARIDTDRFKYFILADLNNAATTDVVVLTSFQVTHIADVP